MNDHDPGIYSQEAAVAEIGDGLWQIDLGFQDRAGVIAAYLMAGDGELGLIETGPSSCLVNLRAVVTAGGATLADTVRCTVYMTDLSAFAEVNEVYGRFFDADPPARVAIGVSALPKGAQVEIDAIVALPS